MIDDDATPTFDGGCCCGHIRFRMTSAPIVVHGCHCQGCQRRHGGAFAVNAMIESDRIVLTGDGKPLSVHTPSALPAGLMVHRCPTCRTALWTTHSELGPAIALVHVGALDRGHGLVPDVHCYTASKHPWIILRADVPQFAQAYDTAAIWSHAARARLAAARLGASRA